MDETDSLAAVQFWKDFPADAEGRQVYETLKEYLNKKYSPRTKEEGGSVALLVCRRSQPRPTGGQEADAAIRSVRFTI
ncbi:MAG: hypothetical protein M3N48_13820 [Verrucomicrobiota bacterium]|nr:hypothetical protein [Verrucomicrobiota bacterium]